MHATGMHATEATAEAVRAMEICNACRYCEGFCAVFPAMEQRRAFSTADVDYLANLCHNCRGCYYACQYAPPHPFGINLPQTFAEVRADSYEAHAWPAPLARLFRRNGTVVSVATAGAIALVLLLAMGLRPAATLYGAHRGPGAFYAVIPWGVMAAVAGASFLYALLAIAIGVRRFWHAAGPEAPIGASALARAAMDVLTLRNLGGGGHGCNDRDEGFTQARRHLHHALFYGFLLCFAATVVATVEADLLGRPAPYPFFSLPVLLGTFGGLGLIAGCAGLIWLKIVADPEPAARRVLGGEYALLVLLLLAAVTGLLLLALRATAAMGIALSVHLGVILALFLALPYSKFVHGPYRSAALLRFAAERTRQLQPPPA